MSDGDAHHDVDGTPPLPGAVALLSIGLTAGICVGGGIALGVVADNLWHGSPWGLIFGLLLGVLVGVASTVKLIQRWL